MRRKGEEKISGKRSLRDGNDKEKSGRRNGREKGKLRDGLSRGKGKIL